MHGKGNITNIKLYYRVLLGRCTTEHCPHVGHTLAAYTTDSQRHLSPSVCCPTAKLVQSDCCDAIHTDIQQATRSQEE